MLDRWWVGHARVSIYVIELKCAGTSPTEHVPRFLEGTDCHPTVCGPFAAEHYLTAYEIRQ